MMNRVVVLLNFFLFCEAQKDITYKEFRCVPGVYYVENDCERCHCNNPSKTLLCVLWWCKSRDEPESKYCEIGTAWSEGCDKCWCTKEVKKICTINCGRKQQLLY